MLDITLLTPLTPPQALGKPLRHKAQEDTGSVRVYPGAARASLMHNALPTQKPRFDMLWTTRTGVVFPQPMAGKFIPC